MRRTRVLHLSTLLASSILALAGCASRTPAAATRATTPLTPVEQLSRDITAATRAPGVERAVWGIAIQSLDRKERLFELNAKTLLVPASSAKLLSVATAADAVGWDYRFQTTVSVYRSADDSLPTGRVLNGDLVVSGTGDPSIGGRAGSDLDGIVAAVKAAGVEQIDGRVIGDDDAIEEPRPALAWAWDDLGYTTGALFGALNFAENRMTVTVAPGAAPGEPTQLTTDTLAIDRPLVNRTVTGVRDSAAFIWPEQRPGEPFLTIAGSLPAGAPPTRLNVAAGNPTLWFASVLRRRLIAAGIAVTSDAVDVDDLDPPLDRSRLSVVFIHRSGPLSAIVQPVLKDSVNLYAEAVMRLNADAGVPTNDAALEGVRRRLTAWGIPLTGQQVVDGSGLSRRDVIAPETLVAILERMHSTDAASPWMQALPIAGIDGSLQGRMKGTAAEGNVRAKTGTMSNVRALAGYATTRDGERLAFAIMLNNFEGTAAEATQAVDAIAIRLAEFSRR